MTELSLDQKRELLARLLRERDAQKGAGRADHGGNGCQPSASAAPELQPVPRSGDLPLSFGQERVWFVEQLQPESLFYNVAERFRFSGRLDVELLRRSIEAVVHRHEVLRTTYPSVDGWPVQRIGPLASWPLRFVDLRHYPAKDRDEEAQRQIVAEAKTPFDLASGPLMRTTLLKLADDEHLLAVTVHHIQIDGWSLRLLMHELAAWYAAFAEGRKPVLPELPVQYADFAQWQRGSLTGTVLATQRAYWLDQLGKHPPALELPTDHPRPPIRTFEGATYNTAVPPSLLAKLRELSRREGVTLFTTLLAGFTTLLMRSTGQEDFVVGTLIAGRVRPEIEHALGFFVNTLALRTDLSGNPTFQEAVARTRDVVIGAHAHEAFPFEKLVEEIRPERGLSSNPLAQVFLNMLNVGSREDLVLPDLRIRPLGGLDIHAVADGLTLFVAENHGQLDLCYVYSTELFDTDTIERVAGHFLALLNGVVAKPDERLWSLPLLRAAERRLIEEISAGSSRSFQADMPLHRLFEAQVQARPDAVAVTYEGQHLSYLELNARANRVARRLRAMGVGPESLVGLCAEPSLDLVIGLLGILKAGGAYVPLDPSYPKGRLAFILADTGAEVVVTHGPAQAALPDLSGAGVLLLEDVVADPSLAEAGNLAEGAGPGNLAYVIYTSGSTGQPKGVLISHENVGRLLASTEPWFHFGPGDVWTLFHSFAFDFSVWELWGALAHGGRLVVVPFKSSRDPQAFLGLLARERVTVLNQTPSAFRQLMEADRTSGLPLTPSLRLVIFGGEALELYSLLSWIERHGDAQPRLINMYGITETCVHVTYRPITRGDVETARGSVIGVPIPDLRVVLRDPHGGLVPFGVPGEMYVGGPGLARGYLNRPELTAERFVPDPLRPGERLYRTGDLARRLPNGELEYLGRIDQQIKIRGFRVELGEIELALVEHPAVREAVVVLSGGGDDGRLLAYVVPANSSTPPERDALRAHLRGALPSYMLPHAFEILSELPLNRNGKVDRRALPAPAPPTAQSTSEPRTATEERVASIWADVLDIERIGPNDNFFERGGQSLLAVRAASRLREAFSIELPVARLFELQTVAELAAHIEAAQRSADLATSSDRTERMPVLARVSRDKVRRPIGSSEPVTGDHR